MTGNGELILVVDDNDLVRHSTRNLLEVLGYNVTEAKTGPMALQQLESGMPIALVLSDVVMPGGMTGIDLAAWVRAHRSDLNIVLTSGYHDLDQSEADNPSLHDIRILRKPYKMEQLEQSVRAALDASLT